MNRNVLLAVSLLLASGCTESPTSRRTTKATPAASDPAQSTPAPIVLPESVPLSEVEIQRRTGGGGGCNGECMDYRVTVRGDGRVTLEDLGWGGKPPAEAPRQRSIPADDAVALIDQLLKARFLEAPVEFDGTRRAVRKGDSLFFRGPGGGEFFWIDLTLRVGTIAKTVRLVDEQAPRDLRSVADQIWKIGGPKAWPVP